MLAVECNVYAFIKACVVYSCKILNPGAPPRWIVPDKIIAHTPQLADARNLSFGTCVQEAQTQDGHSFWPRKGCSTSEWKCGRLFQFFFMPVQHWHHQDRFGFCEKQGRRSTAAEKHDASRRLPIVWFEPERQVAIAFCKAGVMAARLTRKIGRLAVGAQLLCCGISCSDSCGDHC